MPTEEELDALQLHPLRQHGDTHKKEGSDPIFDRTDALSQLSIDADKDWAGKNITNLGTGAYDIAARLAELVAARGSKASVDARLDVELNEDGTSKAKGSKANLNELLDVEHKEDGSHKGEPIVKAWIQFNGTGTIAIQDSFNVSSIVDNGVGDYTINWDTDFANDDYAYTSATSAPGIQLKPGFLLVGSIRVLTFDDLYVATNPSVVCIMAIGDQ